MPSRPPIEAAEETFRRVAGLADPTTIPSVEELTTALRDFGAVEFDVADEPQADGILFEYGTFRSVPDPEFLIGFTRQLSAGDPDGETEGYHQLHLEYSYPVDPDLQAAGNRTEWWFRDDNVDLDRWLGSMRADPVWDVLRTKQPRAFSVFQEEVG
jgi:hypothetical protein